MSTPEDTVPPPSPSAPPPVPTPSPAPAAAAAPPGGMDAQGLAEQFARAYLADRRTERRWRVFFRLSWLLLVIALVYGVVASRDRAGVPSGPHTALIEVRGEIADGNEASAENLVPGIKSAFEAAGAQAVVLRINSPGGSPVQAGIINDEIRRLKKLHGKKAYAVVEESCTSGAYYIAVAADEIFVDKASVVGSIGVLMDGFGATGLMDKLGVERRLLTAGENKGIGDPFSPMPPKQRAYIQAMLDQIHHQFIAVVREGRGKRLKETPDTFTGLFWNGEQAVDLGLADRLGNLDYVAREVVKAEEVVDYTPKENVAERLAKKFGASVGAAAAKAVQGSLTLR
jgi:protease-4